MEVIAASGRQDVGFKPAGGIRTVEDAETYLGLADEIMGSGWARPSTFRFGASGLLDALTAVLDDRAGAGWIRGIEDEGRPHRPSAAVPLIRRQSRHLLRKGRGEGAFPSPLAGEGAPRGADEGEPARRPDWIRTRAGQHKNGKENP